MNDIQIFNNEEFGAVEPQEHQSNPCSVWLMWQEFLD